MTEDRAEYNIYTDQELERADYYASCSGHCPICRNQLDHCGSGHHLNCPIHEAVYNPA
jgi:hypothetical protein